jgi:pyruvate dehydrogenase E2 component (dihydrolipoamide acetyltransferase)
MPTSTSGWPSRCTEGGLIAPALHHADRLSLEELMAGTLDLVERARAGALRSSELSDPTITVTILGDRGVDTVYGVVYPPQVAIVGFGTVVERPWVVDGGVVARRLVRATLAADHRVSDGHRGRCSSPPWRAGSRTPRVCD